MKRIKIQSVSDIITNSSSEVFVKKIDEFGILDEILEAVGVKDDFISRYDPSLITLAREMTFL